MMRITRFMRGDDGILKRHTANGGEYIRIVLPDGQEFAIRAREKSTGKSGYCLQIEPFFGDQRFLMVTTHEGAMREIPLSDRKLVATDQNITMDLEIGGTV